MFGESFAAEYNDYLIQTKAPSHDYKRITRFREVLRQYMGTGEGYIPIAVYKQIFKHLRETRNPNPTDTTIREILKMYKLGKYNEHAVRLAVFFGDFEPLRLNGAQISDLEDMFKQVDRVWPRVKRNMNRCEGCRVCDHHQNRVNVRCRGRHNFLSYTYLLVMFLKLKGLTSEAKKLTPKLLDDKRLAIQQQFGRELFQNNLNWPFFRLIGDLATVNNRFI